MRIYYTVPATDRPSWGMGIIYHHVAMLIGAGYDAVILKEKDLYVPKWLKLDVPVQSYKAAKKIIGENDVLVVAEAMLGLSGLKELKCHKILFIQAPGFLFESMPRNEDHLSLGFSHVLIIMPHMISIVENHIHLPWTMIPPFVADYFFTDRLSSNRQRQILIYPKFHQIDYSIVKYLLDRHIRQTNKSWLRDLLKKENWKIKELKNLSHEEVAEEMKKSTFFISLNTFEALNTSVTEVMAAGCVVFTYEGVGPRDFLKNGENAVVLGNNEAYKLVEQLCDWLDHFEVRQEAWFKMQQAGFNTAKNYTYTDCRKALVSFFDSVSKKGLPPMKQVVNES